MLGVLLPSGACIWSFEKQLSLADLSPKRGGRVLGTASNRGWGETSASMLEIWEKQRRQDQLGLQKVITLIFLFPQEL